MSKSITMTFSKNSESDVMSNCGDHVVDLVFIFKMRISSTDFKTFIVT